VGFNVEGAGDGARFLITQEGARVALTYGNNDPTRRTNRYLDDAFGRDRYAHIALYYRTLLARKRPIYSITTVQDADGKEVSFERMLLPFGDSNRVEQIVGSYKTISVEGRFKVDNPDGPDTQNNAGPHGARCDRFGLCLQPNSSPDIGRSRRTGR
jgi:hypothetical protein